ncbi:nitroreductase family protein [Leekyejoonella antrihumi]|uniref:Nitroreductase family protein n=2 Tax=Leekyejoonella antrihumi TaxID=1660198 RepID=A0A563E3G3_9MICO|nr:nitroreductase family protein [Leekyejoonella antrihumi]TWP37058.1 nitroreductase family protein [Leekyejoonella antrihumi]
MELEQAIRRRRMIRRFQPDAQVPHEVVARIAELALRAPSAGFSQGWDFVVLRDPAEREAFWGATTGDGPPDAWLRGVRTAPTLIVCCSDKGSYLRRYAAPDKPWQDQDEAHWPVPYWDIDTGMAAVLMLLVAVDEGLGGLFFGVETDRQGAVHGALAIPPDRTIIGVIALGYPDQQQPSGSTRSRRRRPVREVFHSGRFGTPLQD